ncbi:BID domain-containing T4SS effector [Bartonella harrusi]|uniref:BID domain-containing T4SS effector n=1 Tax=Bartonella harrusi TaxID=2961895 RepID=A0ABY5EUB6_9HYPH|nr:BID domain-containing T4SS effector [Bartonella harrusi]UTO28078.1 BID domain-containing T4SS effector [Bartonella harrusi]
MAQQGRRLSPILEEDEGAFPVFREEETLSVTEAPQKPQRTTSLQRNSTSSQERGRLSPIPEEDEDAFFFSSEEEILHATTVLQKPQHATSLQRNNTSSQERGSLFATATLQRPTRVLSEEQIMKLLPHSQLVKTYHEKIEGLCQIAYGKKDVLQERMEEIQKNPTIGEGLPWQTATHLQSISKLSGINFLGIRNKARRNAEESLSALCNALDCYREAVIYAKEDLTITPDTILMHYEQSMGREALAEILQNPDHLERTQQALSNAEISTMIQKNPAVKRHHAQIQYWSEVVFGNANLFTEKIEEIFHNPAITEEFTWQLAAFPQSLHRYSGINMCGFKNTTRRHAEAGLSHLIDAVDNFANAVHLQKEQLTAAHQKQLEPSSQQAKNLQRHRDLEKPSRIPEYLSSSSNYEISGTSNTHEKRPDVRHQKIACSKAMALAN